MTNQFNQLACLHLELANMAKAAAERGDTPAAQLLKDKAQKVQTQLMILCSALNLQRLQ